jgi:hypothetical protein
MKLRREIELMRTTIRFMDMDVVYIVFQLVGWMRDLWLVGANQWSSQELLQWTLFYHPLLFFVLLVYGSYTPYVLANAGDMDPRRWNIECRPSVVIWHGMLFTIGFPFAWFWGWTTLFELPSFCVRTLIALVSCAYLSMWHSFREAETAQLEGCIPRRGLFSLFRHPRGYEELLGSVGSVVLWWSVHWSLGFVVLLLMIASVREVQKQSERRMLLSFKQNWVAFAHGKWDLLFVSAPRLKLQ